MIVAYAALFLRVILIAFEKIFVKKLGNNSQNDLFSNVAASFLFFFMGALVLIPFGVVNLYKVDSFGFLLPCYISSLIYAVAFTGYVISISTGEVSLVSSIFSLNLAVLLLTTYFFVGEPITIPKILGIFVMTFGLFMIKGISNIKSNFKYFFTDYSSKWMILCVILQSIGKTVDKFFSLKTVPEVYASCLFIFISLNIFIFLLIKNKFELVKNVYREKKIQSFFSGASNSTSYLCLLFAIKKIDISIVEPLTQLSLIVTIILSNLFFKEKIKEKIPGALVILLGAWIILIKI
ncbi:MAG: EamA family transporter [Fusobacteriaceae bacterium]